MNQANRPVSSKECSWQTVTSWSTSGDCGHAVAWAALAWGWSSRAPGPGVSAPCWALGGHVGPCWIGPGLQGPTSQSKSVPPQPFMGLDFSELLTPAKHPLPRGAHGPCLSHLPDLVLLPLLCSSPHSSPGASPLLALHLGVKALKHSQSYCPFTPTRHSFSANCQLTATLCDDSQHLRGISSGVLQVLRQMFNVH